MKLHPHNRSFSWEPHRGPYRRVTPEQARDYDERGFFVLDDAFDAPTLERVVSEIDPWEEKTTAFLRARPGGKLFIAQADAITFSTHLVTRSPFLRALAAGPVLADLCHDLIGPDVRLYWDQAVYKKPEKVREFPWHQDNGYNFVEPQAYLTCWIALSDATVENGCPWVVPGVHRRGTLEHWPTDLGWQCLDAPEGAVAVPARAGSVVVFSSLTPHRTGPNTTDAVRKAYIVQFAPAGARMIPVDPESGARRAVVQDDPERQFEVLRGGRPVPAPPLAG